MNIWIRRIGLPLAALLVVIGGVLAYLVATFDPNRYQGLLVDWVQTHQQRTLSFGSPISLSFFPRLQVKLGKVTLSEHRRPDQFLAVEEAELSVDVMPLLKRRLVVDKIAAKGVTVHYLRDAQGHSNIDDLLESQKKPDEPSQPGEPLQFNVAAIELARVQAQVKDDMSGVQGTLLLNRFQSGRVSEGMTTNVELDADATFAKPVAAKGGLKGSLRITPHFVNQSAELDKLDLKLRGDGPVFQNLEAAISGALAWDGAHKSASAKGLKLEASGTLAGQGATAPTVLDKGRVTVDGFEYDPGRQRLQLDKLAVAVQAKRGGHPLDFSLDWPSLNVQGDQLSGSPLKGDLKLGGPVEVAGQFKSQSPTGGFKQLKVPGLQFDFKIAMAGQGGQREVTGQVLSDVTAQPAKAAGLLQPLRVQARIQEPALQPLEIKLDGQVAVSQPTKAEWTLQGRINGNPLSSRGVALLTGKVPRVDAVASFASLDLNRVLPAAAPASASAPTASSSGASADTPVDLSALRLVDGQFKLGAGQLAYRQYRLSHVDIDAVLNGGKLRLNKLSADAWGGRIVASGNAQIGPEPTMQRVGLKAQADGINILAVLKDVMNKEVLEGTGQIKLDVQSSGLRMSQLVAGLNGSGALALRDGAVHGINLAKSLREFKAKLSVSSDTVQRAQQTEKTDFSEMTASFAIINGVAHNKDLSAKSPFLRLGGAGDIDLVQRRLDYTVSATVTGTAKGQGGADIAALSGVTVPVKLKGPFDAPDWQIAWSDVALGAMQNTLKNQLEGQVGKSRGQLEEQLKAKLGLGLGLGKAADGQASGVSAPASPRDAARQQLQDKLKGLFR